MLGRAEPEPCFTETANTDSFFSRSGLSHASQTGLDDARTMVSNSWSQARQMNS